MMSRYREIDYGAFCRLVESSLPIQRRYQFFLWSRGELQTFLPHRTILCAVGELARQNYRLERFSEYPDDGKDLFHSGNGFEGFLNRLISAWRCGGHVPIVLDAQARDGEPALALEGELAGHGLEDCSTHGLLDHDHGIGALFLFLGGLCEPRRLRARRLELLVPHLCAALYRVDHAERLSSRTLAEEHLLSAREAEIMHWIRAGKTNQEIGQILDISPYTVKNHVQKILRKLNVINRAQAAGKLGRHGQAGGTPRETIRLVGKR